MSLSQRLYNAVMMLDNFTCVYCGYRGADITIDHYIPRSKGGTDVVQNLVAACGSCNSQKGDRAPYEAKMITMYGRFTYVQVLCNVVDPPKLVTPKPMVLISTPDASDTRLYLRKLISGWLKEDPRPGKREVARRLYRERGGQRDDYSGDGELFVLASVLIREIEQPETDHNCKT